MAVWAMISNATANLFITIWRPFQLGDTVELLPENFKGCVVVRNLMSTVLREENGARLFVPDNLFFQKIFKVLQEEHPLDPTANIRTVRSAELGHAAGWLAVPPNVGMRALDQVIVQCVKIYQALNGTDLNCQAIPNFHEPSNSREITPLEEKRLHVRHENIGFG